MKLLLTIIAALGLALWLGLGLHGSAGKMIISVAGWRIDAPLWLAAVAFILSYFLLHFFVRLALNVMNTPAFLKKMTQNMHKKRAKRYTKKGLVALAEGQYIQAEKMLIRGAQYSENPWWNYLCAAKAAQAQGANERRDNYLKRAYDDTPDAKQAISVTQAELQYQQGQYNQSIHTLKQLIHHSPHHEQALKLLQLNLIELKDWQALLELLPKLKRDRVLANDQLQALEVKAYTHILKELDKTGTFKELSALWHKMPSQVRVHPDVAIIYAQALIHHLKPIEAESVIKNALKQHWREDLVRLYGQILHPQPKKMLVDAEQWLNLHPESAALLQTLGRICEQMQLWGKAQRYFEASLALEPCAQTYAELGTLLEKMNQPELGAQYFRKGLLLANPVTDQHPLRAPGSQ